MTSHSNWRVFGEITAVVFCIFVTIFYIITTCYFTINPSFHRGILATGKAERWGCVGLFVLLCENTDRREGMGRIVMLEDDSDDGWLGK